MENVKPSRPIGASPLLPSSSGQAFVGSRASPTCKGLSLQPLVVHGLLFHVSRQPRHGGQRWASIRSKPPPARHSHLPSGTQLLPSHPPDQDSVGVCDIRFAPAPAVCPSKYSHTIAPALSRSTGRQAGAGQFGICTISAGDAPHWSGSSRPPS